MSHPVQVGVATFIGNLMRPSLILCGMLALGQQPAPPTTPPLAAPRGDVAGRTTAPVATIDGPQSPSQPEPSPDASTPTTTPDRWAVMKRLQGTRGGEALDNARLSISGWTEGAFTASTDRIQQLPLGFNYRANQFLLQQNWLRIERTVDPSASTPTWGFRSDTILPGSDYRFTLPRGLFNGQLTANDGQPNLYGIDPVQFYGELNLPHVGRGLDVKLGRFFVLFGVESIDTTQNALTSHAYTFLDNPFTHTGLLGSLKLNDDWTAQSGIVTGSDIFVGPEANPTYIGGVKWAPPDGHSSFLLSVILGDGRYDVAHAFSNPQVFDVVYTHKLGEKSTYTLDALYSFQHNFPGVGASGFVNDWGVVQYLTHQWTSTFSATARLEFFGDPQGQRTGTKGVYEAVTAGFTWKPKPWLLLRPEVRYDHNNGQPFEGHSSLFTAAFDFVVRW